jgi:spore coat protein CotH
VIKNEIKVFQLIMLFLVFLLFNCTSFPEPEIGDIEKVRLHLDQDSLKELNESEGSDDYTTCVYEDSDVKANALVKVRGNISRRYNKRSYTVKYTSREGTIRYALDGSYKDPSHIRNYLCLYTYREIGLPAPPAERVGLFINGVYMGYYTRIEMYSQDGLDLHYGRSSELFKANFNNIGYDIPIHGNSEKKFPDEDDYTSLDILIANAKSMDDQSWITWIQTYVNVEDIARYLVVHDFLTVTDTVQKNFYICYYGKYSILPWDNEASIRRRYFGAPFDSVNYSLGGNNLLTRRLMQPGSPIRTRYIALFKELFIDNSDLTDKLINKVNELYAEIDRAIYYEPIRFWDYVDFVNEKDFILTFLNERKGEISDPPIVP